MEGCLVQVIIPAHIEGWSGAMIIIELSFYNLIIFI